MLIEDIDDTPIQTMLLRLRLIFPRTKQQLTQLFPPAQLPRYTVK